MKEYGFNIKVFNFTVTEVCKVLNNYDPNKYSSDIEIASVYTGNEEHKD